MDIKLAIQLFQNMGIRYTAYRVRHEIEKCLGSLEKKYPRNPDNKFFISLAEWRENTPLFVIDEREKLTFSKNPSGALKEEARRILNGEICFFNHEWLILGQNYDWITNPITSYQYDITKHWSRISDFNRENGDIKYVWEKSRFAYILTLIRSDYNFNEDHSEFVFSEIENWIDVNQINQGPNWKCSQEISLRTLNWIYALNFYKNSASLTETRWGKIQNAIYWSLHHVYTNINFSRIAVRNNHAITETLMLTLSEFIFPFIPETKEWAKRGRKWFEQEIAYQIYEDGTFLQFSMNYHRVVIQLLSLGISLTEKHNKKFSAVVYSRAAKSLDFLYQCLQEENGHLPNYGSNDGALFFPLSNSNYSDYRPQLNTLHFVLYNQYLYDEESIKQDSYWVKERRASSNTTSSDVLKKKLGIISYTIGGYYLIREKATFTFIRCGNHKDRPAHADNLHMDVWYKGHNILRDSGTYKYNTEAEFQNYFTGSASHNTVMVGNHSQMLKGSRFIWYFWSQALVASLLETEEQYIFKGKISAFRFLNPKARHERTIIKNKEENKWRIIDCLEGLDSMEKNQIWHHDNHQIDFEARINDSKVNPRDMVSYNSSYYGVKQNGMATGFAFDSEISTTITLR
ncbi:MAG: heparinase II/III-family protein [Bacteroidota bacterium]